MFASLNSQRVDDGDSHLEESELITDIHTVPPNHMQSHRIRESGDHTQNTISEQISGDSIFTSQDGLCRGRIDIILHPLYQVPCPYIQLFDSNGQPVTADRIQLLIRTFRLEMYADHNRAEIDDTDKNTSYLHDCTKSETIGKAYEKEAKCRKEKNFLEYLYEEHPYTLTPCLCLHVCGLGASLALIDTTDAISNNNQNRSSNLRRVRDGNISNPTTDLYLLSWFTLVGPAIGIKMDLSSYQAASEFL